MTDSQLLEKHATHEGEVAELAFAVVVERHSPMVLRTLRSTLRDPNDVDDAFQATFLVLLRRAGDLKVDCSVGPWLYGVACRVATAVRRTQARRRLMDQRTAKPTSCRNRPDEPTTSPSLSTRRSTASPGNTAIRSSSATLRG